MQRKQEDHAQMFSQINWDEKSMLAKTLLVPKSAFHQIKKNMSVDIAMFMNAEAQCQLQDKEL